jgi:hypothetical protein
MTKIIRDTYDTYYNTAQMRPEKHLLRLLGICFVALCFCVFSSGPHLDINNMMITGLTILTGFTFTALFSDHSLADVGLPKPANETDRYDLKRLSILAHNFHVRSRYFIACSILDVCLLIYRSIELSPPPTFKTSANYVVNHLNIDISSTVTALSYIGYVFDRTAAFISVFIFLECLYTFYRLAETIISIVNARRDYLKAR